MTKSSFKKAAPQLVRQINRASILEIVKNEGPISRADIARKTQFSKVTVSSIIRDLITENLIQEKIAQTSSRGVKPVLYTLNREDHLFGAISIEQTQTIVAIVNIESKIIARETFPTLIESSEACINLCIERLEELKRKVNTQKLVGIGVSIPGTLDFSRTELIQSINLNWHHVPLKKMFSKKISEQIAIENDTRCAALAEWNFSPNPAIRDADIFIFIKYGVACNLKINDLLFTGRHNLACEFGHLIVNSSEDLNDTREPGFLKNFISDKATVQYYHQLTGDQAGENIDQEIDWILRQAQTGQPEAVQTVKRFIKFLAIGIANLSNLVDPHGIVIFGKITRIWDLIHNDLITEILKYTIQRDKKMFSLYPSSLNDDAVIIGAATLIIRQFMKYPKLLSLKK